MRAYGLLVYIEFDFLAHEFRSSEEALFQGVCCEHLDGARALTGGVLA